MRPAARIEELVAAKSPGLHLGAQAVRHARAGGQKSEQPSRVALVRVADRRSRLVIGVRIIPVGADEVSGEAAVVVDVGLAIGHGGDVHEIVERGRLARCEEMNTSSNPNLDMFHPIPAVWLSHTRETLVG